MTEQDDRPSRSRRSPILRILRSHDFASDIMQG
jgi:hypothetical protein